MDSASRSARTAVVVVPARLSAQPVRRQIEDFAADEAANHPVVVVCSGSSCMGELHFIERRKGGYIY